jgi:hypothetical protein
VAVALAILSANGGTNTTKPVDKSDFQQQVDGIRQFLQDHSR